MNDFDHQKTDRVTQENEPEDFEFEISDLPPSENSHYVLIRLVNTKKRLLEKMTALAHAARGELEQNGKAARIVNGDGARDADDFELEISDLPPTSRSHYLLLKLIHLWARLPGTRRARSQRPTPLTRTQRRARSGQILTALGVCAALLMLLVGNVPDLRTRLVGFFIPTPTPTTVQVGTITNVSVGSSGAVITHPGSLPRLFPHNSASPGSLPSSCPNISSLQDFMTPLDPPGLGASPLWITGFIGPSAALNDLRQLNTSMSPNTPAAWYETLAVFVQRGFPGTIVLQGESQQSTNTGGLVMFSDSSLMNFNSSFLINLNDPDEHFILDGSWEMLPVNVSVPTAGCFTLRATWFGSSWIRYFAAGD